MTLERAIRILAGTIVLVCLTLSQLVSAWFLAGVAFVGINLVQSALTGFCPAERVLRRFGLRDSCAITLRAHEEVA